MSYDVITPGGRYLLGGAPSLITLGCRQSRKPLPIIYILSTLGEPALTYKGQPLQFFKYFKNRR